MTQRQKIKEKATLGDSFQNNSRASFLLLKIGPYILGMIFFLFNFLGKATMHFPERLRSSGKD